MPSIAVPAPACSRIDHASIAVRVDIPEVLRASPVFSSSAAPVRLPCVLFLVAVRLSRVRQLVSAGNIRAKIVAELAANLHRVVSGVRLSLTTDAKSK
jgi:hypothetical protein